MSVSMQPASRSSSRCKVHDGDTVTWLMQSSFYHHFHPHIPLLNNRVAIDKYFQLSPVLFWTVLAVATRCWKMQPDLHRRLRGPLMQLLWTSISAVPVSHFTIQAILLLCTWPFSPDSLISDPTFVLVSTARTACMQLGVHRPKQMQDYHRVRFEVRREQVREAVMIWVTCFIVAERYPNLPDALELALTSHAVLRLVKVTIPCLRLKIMCWHRQPGLTTATTCPPSCTSD